MRNDIPAEAGGSGGVEEIVAEKGFRGGVVDKTVKIVIIHGIFHGYIDKIVKIM